MGMKTQYMKKHFYKNRIRSVMLWIVEIVIVLLLAALFAIFMCKSIVVQEGSMEPTLEAGNEVLINTVAYRFSSPKRGDIIAFRLGDDTSSSVHIKRIIGLPGETVQIQDGKIYINGIELNEDYGAEPIEDPGIASAPITLGEDEYFVLGDNRNNSQDSRTAAVGNMSRDEIFGRAWIRFWPLDSFCILKHQ